jgi:hypothetical protein
VVRRHPKPFTEAEVDSHSIGDAEFAAADARYLLYRTKSQISILPAIGEKLVLRRSCQQARFGSSAPRGARQRRLNRSLSNKSRWPDVKDNNQLTDGQLLRVNKDIFLQDRGAVG